MKKTLLGLGAGVVIVAAAAPWIVGQQAEKQFDQQLQQLSNSLDASSQVLEYDRGWFSSTAKTKTLFSNADVSLIINHKIKHGPYATFGWASIESTIQFDNAPLLKQIFGEKPPVSLSSQIGYGGQAQMHLASPALKNFKPEGDTAVLNWGGATADIQATNNRIHYSFNAPKLDVQDQQQPRHLTLTDAQLTGFSPLIDQLRPDHASDWQSEQDFQLQQFQFKDDLDGLLFKTGLAWHFDSGLNADQQLDIHSQVKLADSQLQSPDIDNGALFNIDPLQLDLAATGLAPAPLAKFSNKLAAFKKDWDMDRQPYQINVFIRKDLPEALQNALTADSRLTLDLPNVSSNLGKWSLSLEAGFDDDFSEDAYTPLIVSQVQALYINFKTSWDEKLAQTLSAEQYQMLQALVSEGWIQYSDDRYRITAQLQDQTILVNGEPKPELLQLLFSLF